MRPRRIARVGLVGVFGIAIACGSGVSNLNGLQAELRVSGAQFFPGAEPTPNANGPTVSAPGSNLVDVQLGQINVHLSGQLSDDAVAVAFHLTGDIGYWTEAAVAGDLTVVGFSTSLSFNPNTLPADGGVLAVELNAINGSGEFGPTVTVPFSAVPGFPSAANLVVSLNWDTESDLDLHVIQPDGTEIWSNKRSSYIAPLYPSPSAPPGTIKNYFGYLDFDSNAQCLIDGRREENAVWQKQPPNPDAGFNPPYGHYQVKVDTWSLCGTPSANYQITVYSQGKVIRHTEGETLPIDTRPPHGAGAGLTVLTFDIVDDGGVPDAGANLSDGGA